MGGSPVQVEHRPGAAERAEIGELLDRATANDGHRPLDEQHQRDLLAGRSRGLTALLARDHRGALVAYAHLMHEHGTWSVEVVVDPPRRDDGAGLAGDLLAAAGREVSRRGGGLLRYWAPTATGRDDALAAALGFAIERDLLQLRVDLPLPAAVRHAVTPPAAVRAFRPGRDEAAWLDVNNRAFAGHPEQGAWDLATLLDREAQPWFDPEGFLVAEEGGRLAGSCWTKVHRDEDPVLGEIYIISVDPECHQRGLGRTLAVAGLDHLAAAGVPVGMLYVDGDNEAALALYRSLGFTVHHVDRAYAAQVAPAS
jgi:mycothiol synthase